MDGTASTGLDELQFLPTKHALLYLILSSSLLAVILKVVYNVFFHPLSSYPGPKLWAISRLPLTRANINGRMEAKILSFHRRYGDTIRIAPDELSYTSATAWKTIYGYRSNEMPKPRDGRGIPLPPNDVDSMVTAVRENHARIRRSVNHAFSEKALREQEPLVQGYMSLLVDGIHKHGTEQPIDMVSWYNRLAFDIIGDLSLACKFDNLKNARDHPMVSFMVGSNKSIPVMNALRHYGLWPIMKKMPVGSALKARQGIVRQAYERLDERLASDTDQADFFSYILRHDDYRALSRQEMQTQALGFLIAGGETTSTTLAAITHYTLKNPAVYQKLVKEVREKLSGPSDVTMVKVTELTYMGAVIKEALRIYPPVSGSLPRVVPNPGEEIEGKFVPAGTVVGVPHEATYLSKKNFHRPEAFVPERWLGEDAPSEFAKDDFAAMQVFSLGPRACIGKNLAWAEMRLALAHVLINFDLELVGNHEGWDDNNVFLNRERKPLMVKFTPVQAALA